MNVSNLSAKDKLARFYKQFTGEDQVLILMNADPDAIACAMAVKRLLWRKTSGIDISHINVIKRPDNLAMIRLLGVNLIHIKEIDKAMYTKVVMVDSQPDHSELFDGFSPAMIIDHHPDTAYNASFADIRPAYGAAATIMTEYIRAAGIKPSAKLATALFYAIKTDTSNFERETVIEDLRAFQFLFRHANTTLARRIDQAELKLDFLKYFRKALREKRIRKGRIFVHLGRVSNPDICVLIADFFMRIESVNWSIVSGFNERKLIVIFRNDGIRKNAGAVAKSSLGVLGSAGGHKSAARAEIPTSIISRHADPKDDKKMLRWIINRIEKKAGKAPDAASAND